MERLENTILRNLLYNEEYARKTLPFFKDEYFTQFSDRVVFQEIKKYDPNWDGTGRSKEEREQKRIVLKESFYKNIAAQAQRFVSGALVAKIIEGTTPPAPSINIFLLVRLYLEYLIANSNPAISVLWPIVFPSCK